MQYELDKLESSDSFGLWDTAIYIVSADPGASIIGANSIRSLVIGDESGKAESFINYWDNSERSFTHGSAGKILKYLHYGMHPVFEKKGVDSYYFTPAVAIGGKVLPSVLGLPMRSVPGVTVIESAEFGRNIVTDDHSAPGIRKIRLGEIMYMGKTDNTKVDLFVNSLSMHTFICGAPGSGKSNTVYKMIYELCRLGSKPERDGDYGGVKFLVIEPAKGEYKYEFGKMSGINIYTTRIGLCQMLCINPFEFPYQKMDVREHIERLKNILSACWPLTAAMPSILSSAIEYSFVRVGWDIENSMFINPGKIVYPSFKDLLISLEGVINSSDYSENAKSDYRGALLTRVQSLTKGIAGTVFVSTGAVPDYKLFDENTIIDLSMVGSTETRSLIMGMLVMKLENYRKVTADQSNYPLRHVTILEEAHNLLPRCSTQQSNDSANVQGKSVESISSAISEMRTYGEGFIIVDQSPSAVATVAISNTSTKIVMRLPDMQDMEAAGSSIGLNAEQVQHIAMLPQGQGIVKQGNWIMPVEVLIDKAAVSYRTKKLKEFDNDDLKAFRSEAIEKIIVIAKRCRQQATIPVADKNSIIKYIDKQNDIADYQKELAKHNWSYFCDCDSKGRLFELSRLIVRILSMEDTLAHIKPPKKKEYNNHDVEVWYRRIVEILPAYILLDDENSSDLMKHIINYLATYSIYPYVRTFAEKAESVIGTVY